VLAGNTSDKTTLADFLAKIEAQYGKANRIWVMDRGIPTEETLTKMRTSSPPVSYLVGTPKGRLTALEKDFVDKPWSQAREAVNVKLLEQEGEVYILAKSEGRLLKERGMRRKKLKKFWARLKDLLRQAPSRDRLLLKIGAAQKEAGRAASLVTVKLPKSGQPVTPETFTFTLNRKRLRACRRHEGRYLLRSNLLGQAPAELWAFYIQLTEVEQAFKELKGDLAIRPVYHQTDERIEAHIPSGQARGHARGLPRLLPPGDAETAPACAGAGAHTPRRP
jgi:transposase